MYLYRDACIVQFAKAPELGKVKTRLQPALGAQGCVDLHKALLEKTFNSLAESGLAAYRLCVTPGSAQYFNHLLDGSGAELCYQQGANLGERMAAAFVAGFKNYRKIVIIGSDCPALDESYLSRALDYLEQGEDAVYGPALDGGYVLVGLSKVSNNLFDGVPWGTDRVMSYTRNRLRSEGFRWRELQALPDIDVERDLGFLKNWEEFAEFLPAGDLTF